MNFSNVNNGNFGMIGYLVFYITEEWEYYFDLIINSIKNYDLYNKSAEIRLFIINNKNIKIDIDKNLRFNDVKIKIVNEKENINNMGMLYIKNNFLNANTDVLYWYLDLNMLEKIDENNKSYIVDWLKYVLYWIIVRNDIVLEKMIENNLYTCNNNYIDYWWAKESFLKKLELNDKFQFVFLGGDSKAININSSNINHLKENWNIDKYVDLSIENNVIYKIPDDFNVEYYRLFNVELKNLSNVECINHFLKEENKNKKYKIDDYIKIQKVKKEFDVKFYRETYPDLNALSDTQLLKHWFECGEKEGRIYKASNIIANCNKKNTDIINNDFKKNVNSISNDNKSTSSNTDTNNILPKDFDPILYKKFNPDLNHLSNNELIQHWLNNGKNENRTYKLPDNFNLKVYKKKNTDLNGLKDNDIIDHFIMYGMNEGREYSVPDNFDINYYRKKYKDVCNFTDEKIIEHWIEYGIDENREYKLPDDFDLNYYKKRHYDLYNLTDEELIDHWIYFGSVEKRDYKIPDFYDIYEMKKI